jgi:hypothetical protein
MAVSRLTCPECGRVLRPAKPVAAGKKVRCPECDTVFVAGEEDDDRPRRPAAPKGGKTAAAGGKKSAPKKQEAEEVYGYIKDPDEEDEDKKPRIDYAPDESIKDLRGPAIVILTGPVTKLQMVGMFGVIGWVLLFVLLLIPTVFPITPDEKEKEKAKQDAMMAKQKGKDAKPAAPKGPGFFSAFGFDFSGYFVILMVPMIAMAVYSAMVVGGGIKAQNLESRRWGIAASIMAMLPIHIAGLGMVTFMVFQWAMTLVMDEPEYLLLSVIVGVEYLISLGVGAVALKALMNEDVIAGFEFEPE